MVCVTRFLSSYQLSLVLFNFFFTSAKTEDLLFVENIWHILGYSYICVIVYRQDCPSHWWNICSLFFSTSQQLLMSHLMFYIISHNQNEFQKSYLIVTSCCFTTKGLVFFICLFILNDIIWLILDEIICPQLSLTAKGKSHGSILFDDPNI